MLTFQRIFFYQGRCLWESSSFWCLVFVSVHSFFALQKQMQDWNYTPLQQNFFSWCLDFFFQIIHFLTDLLHYFYHFLYHLWRVDIFIFCDNACFQLWWFDPLYSFGLSRPACCTMISQDSGRKPGCLIPIQKKITFEWLTDTNQILWFISSFTYVATLWFCLWSVERRPFNDITSQMINCWIEIRRTIFFFMKNLVWWIWMFNCSITKKQDFWKKHSKILY